MSTPLINANPTIYSDLPTRRSDAITDPFDSLIPTMYRIQGGDEEEDHHHEDPVEPIDAQEVFDYLKDVSDPEHPLTLSQLAVVNLDHIQVIDSRPPLSSESRVIVEITPTIPHCSMATLIGLCVRVRLERALPSRFRIDVKVRQGTHQSENQVNRQLADKERVAAACENEQLMSVLAGMLATCK